MRCRSWLYSRHFSSYSAWPDSYAASCGSTGTSPLPPGYCSCSIGRSISRQKILPADARGLLSSFSFSGPPWNVPYQGLSSADGSSLSESGFLPKVVMAVCRRVPNAWARPACESCRLRATPGVWFEWARWVGCRCDAWVACVWI